MLYVHTPPLVCTGSLGLHNMALTRFSIVMQRLLIYPLPLLSQRSEGQRLVEPITTNIAGTSGVTHFPDLKERRERNISSFVPRPCPAFANCNTKKWQRGQIIHFSILQAIESLVGPGNEAKRGGKRNTKWLLTLKPLRTLWYRMFVSSNYLSV